MDLEWRQKQLLKILYEEGINSIEKSFAVHLKFDRSGKECFFFEGVQRSQGGEELELHKAYPAEFVYPLEDNGYISLKHSGTRNPVYRTRVDEDETNAYALWITSKGERLVERDFK